MFSVVGIGWSNGFLGSFKKKLGFGALVLPASVGITVFACVAILDFAYFGSRVFSQLLVVITSCLGMIHPRNKRVLKTKPTKVGKLLVRSKKNSKLIWLIPVALMVALIPNIGPEGQLTVANRVGPDAVAYLLNTRVIYNGERLDDVRKRIELNSSESMSNLSNPDNPLMYTLTSWNDQIASGFLFDALRWAPSALVSSVLSLPGLKFTDLFEISTVVLILSALIGSVLLGGYVAEVSNNKFLGVLSCISFLLCPITLFNWQEGFWLQILAMPYLVMLAISLFDVKDHDPDRSSVQLTVALLGIVLFYPDLLIIYLPLVVGVLALHFARLRKIPSRQFIQFWVQGIVTSLVLVIPLTIRLPKMIISRLIQSPTSGFWLPSWGSIFEIFGILNPYHSDNLYSSIAKSSSLVPGWLLILNFVSVLVISFGLLRSFNKSDVKVDILIVSVLGGLITLYKVRTEGSPNYQFIKLQGYLLPLIFILTMDAVGRLAIRLKHAGEICMRIWLVLLISVGIKFGYDFRRSAATTHIYHKDKMSLFDDVSAQKAFNSYNIIYAGSNIAVMGEIASAQSINWVHRDFGGLSTDFRDRKANPMALVLSDSEKQWGCLSFLQSDLVFRSETAGVALIMISSNSLSSLKPEDAQSVFANYLSSKSMTAEELSSGCNLKK